MIDKSPLLKKIFLSSELSVDAGHQRSSPSRSTTVYFEEPSVVADI